MAERRHIRRLQRQQWELRQDLAGWQLQHERLHAQVRLLWDVLDESNRRIRQLLDVLWQIVLRLLPPALQQQARDIERQLRQPQGQQQQQYGPVPRPTRPSGRTGPYAPRG